MNKINYKLFMLLAILVATKTIAAPLDARDDVKYIKQGTYGSGWVNINPENGGHYVYGIKNNADARPNTAFMIGQPDQQDLVFLTAEEQEGVWRYRNDAREALRKAALPPTPVKKTTHKSYLNLNWPRVTVAGAKVCVPDLAFSDDPDWKNHLTCTLMDSANAK